MKKSIGQEAFGKLQTKIVILKSILGLDLSVLVDTLKLPIDFCCNDMFIPLSWHRCGEQGGKENDGFLYNIQFILQQGKGMRSILMYLQFIWGAN